MKRDTLLPKISFELRLFNNCEIGQEVLATE